ncbi:MAG: General secretory pathway protein E [Microgenomates group bacterium GW2011_GWC1_49_7]|nr:MAG: General secretory pathway protein E [Microgenomates group bacterium GW2011_GWC1_49_7]
MILSNEQLAALVTKSGLSDPTKLADAVAFAETAHVPLSAALVEKGVLTDEQIGTIVASSFNVPFVVLSKFTIPQDVFHVIPEKVARKQKAVAFVRDASGIKVALSDPANTALVAMVAKKTNERVLVHYATDRDIENTLQVYKKVLQKTIDELLKEDIKKATTAVYDELPIAKIVDVLIDAAYQDKASDIHIEPEEKHSLIRFRIDGVLHEVLRVPKVLHDRIITRIKVLSGLRTDEHMSAQDGKMRLSLEEENLDIRVSIIPIVEGEKAVLRLLSSRSREISLIDLGMSEKDLAKVTGAYNKSYGMILSTGPTGSGKTTTIYSILKILNTREKNITTIEDPVEYRIKGANQVQMNPKTNLTFASGLRSILRQDPNIIFVGEIRDSETAGIAVNAALTGHLVLSTLHTNDAATAIPRLSDMKVEPFLVASTVNIIVAQRLVRKICDMCKTTQSMTQEELTKHLPAEVVQKHFGTTTTLTLYKGKGCKICHNTGYSGRLGVFEVLEVSKEIRRLITEKSDSDIINKAAIDEGMTTMLDDGLDKVQKGLTTINEVIRVTKVESL